MTWQQDTARLIDTADIVDADTACQLHSVDVDSVDSVTQSNGRNRRCVYTPCAMRAVAL